MWQVVGQDKAVAFLDKSITKGQVSHAYLLVGPPHVGKGTLAMNLAQALNCTAEKVPCGECGQCRRIASGKHPDVVVIGLPTASDRGQGKEISIDEVRALRQTAYLRPFEGRCRVFIIDGAEHLSHEAANSLLKILEEPPPDVVLILTTVDERALLLTVRSRCQRVTLARMPMEALAQALVERWGVPPEHAKIIAPQAKGCLGWAVTAWTDKNFLVERARKLAEIQKLAASGIEGRLAYSSRLAAQFPQQRETVKEFIDVWEGWWRDLMLIRGRCEAYVVNAHERSALGEQGKAYSMREIKDFLVKLREATYNLDNNVNPRLALDVLMLSMPYPKVGRKEAEASVP